MLKYNIMAATILGGLSSPVFAQEAADSNSAEIIVTAQKRDQRITDVPMAISAYDSATLERVGATELNRVAELTPGLVIQLQDRFLPGISLRGITSDDTSPAAEPRVALFQDGVPITQIASGYSELFDVDRVEVEKGPQSTLHGRSALNGGISVFQKMPTRDFGAELKGGLGNYGYRLLQGTINLPVSDSFGVRVGGLVHKRDGFLKDVQGDRSYNNVDSRAFRLTAKFEPNDTFYFKFAGTYDYDGTKSGGAFKSGIFVPLDQTTGAVAGDSLFWTPTRLGTFGQLPADYSRRKVLGLSGTTGLTLSDALDLTAISGYRWYTTCQAGDIDGTPTNIVGYEQCNGGEQFSQELRLNIKKPGVFEGFVGAGLFKAKNDLLLNLASDERAAALLLNGALQRSAPTGLTNNQINALLGARAALLKPYHVDRREQTADIETYDIFADGTVQLTEALEVFAGGRVTWDSKDLTVQATTPAGVSRLTGRGLLFTSTPGTVPLEGSHSSTLLTGRAGLRYVFSPKVNVYAVYGIGKRPEIIDISPTGAKSIIPAEQLRSVEAGVKFSLMSGRLTGDASVYHYTYDNFQTFQRTNGVLSPVNAGSASATGFETQANWRVSGDLSIFGSYGYNHARFSSGAYNGNSFRNSPDHKFALGFDAATDVSFGRLSLTPTYSWQSKMFFSDDNDRADLQVRSPAAFSDTRVDEVQKSFGLLNSRLKFTPDAGKWSLALVGDNLLDTKFIVDAGNSGDLFGIPTFVPGSRRTVRVEFTLGL